NAPGALIVSEHDPRDSRPVRRQFRNVLLFFWSPAELFERLREKPEWLVAFLCVSAITIVITLAMQPFTMRIVELSTPPGMSPEKLDQFYGQVKLFQYAGLALVPAVILAKCLLSAGLLSTLMVLFAGDSSFKANFSLFNHVGLIPALQSAVSLLVLGLRGLDEVRGPLDLRVSMGLNMIIRPQNLALDAVLNSVNILDIWYLVALIIAVRSLVKCSRLQASLAAGSFWLFTVALQVGLVVIGSHSVPGK